MLRAWNVSPCAALGDVFQALGVHDGFQVEKRAFKYLADYNVQRRPFQPSSPGIAQAQLDHIRRVRRGESARAQLSQEISFLPSALPETHLIHPAGYIRIGCSAVVSTSARRSARTHASTIRLRIARQRCSSSGKRYNGFRHKVHRTVPCPASWR